ncbi:MAG: fibro-slime domain-containing protein [Phycisphaerales bacterium]|jgi:fibro-slime domain-containing protein|nr:fibro-slime domain-containing protein [Phycisphaerales bacterium]
MNTRMMTMVAGLTVLAGVASADPYKGVLAETMTLNAVIRDFRGSNETGGHPDFEKFTNPFITADLVEEKLGANGLPVFRSTHGAVISTEWRDDQGRAINRKHFGKPRAVRVGDKDGDVWLNVAKGKGWKFADDDDKDKGGGNDKPNGGTRGGKGDKDDNDDKKSESKQLSFIMALAKDTAGNEEPGINGRHGTSHQLTSAERFSQWYRDVPGVNMSTMVPLTFNRVPGTNQYVFDSETDPLYKSRGGFFPINGELFGNYQGWGKNFHFTTQIETKFTYEKGKGHIFTFRGDDDVWVYIDGRLILDLGGLHPRREQTVEIDRLDWLEDGREYDLKIFHAERRTSQSNFRVETTIVLRRAELPSVTNMFD